MGPESVLKKRTAKTKAPPCRKEPLPESARIALAMRGLSRERMSARHVIERVIRIKEERAHQSDQGIQGVVMRVHGALPEEAFVASLTLFYFAARQIIGKKQSRF